MRNDTSMSAQDSAGLKPLSDEELAAMQRNWPHAAAETTVGKTTVLRLLATIAAKDAEIIRKIDSLNEAVTRIGGLEDSVRTLQAIRAATEAERDALKAEVEQAEKDRNDAEARYEMMERHRNEVVDEFAAYRWRASLTPKEN